MPTLTALLFRWNNATSSRRAIWSPIASSSRELEFGSGLVYEVRYEFVPTTDTPSLEMKGTKTVLDLVDGSHEMTPSNRKSPVRIRVLEWASLEKAKAASRPLADGRVDSLYTQLKPMH